MRPLVCIYDDPTDLAVFAPFAASRPIGELRYGALLLRERIARESGGVEAQLCAPHLAEFAEEGAPPVALEAQVGRPRVFLRSTFVPSPGADLAGASTSGASVVRLTDSEGDTIGCVLARGAWMGPSAIPADAPTLSFTGRRIRGAWELVRDLVPTLSADLDAMVRERGASRVPAGCSVLGDPSLVICDGASVEPYTVFDTRGGPVVLEHGVEVRSFTRLQGPLYAGPGTRIVGGQLRESSIGPRCVVHGEVSNSIFLGYANKSHDGFLGHSIVGRWVNLGAGTVTSNLKNTYGPVRLDLGQTRVDTGMMFLGALIGDHVKTAIGTMLPTGCVIGVGANVFGTRRPGNHVKPFAWGTDEPDRVMACRMFLQVAERVMPRRDVKFDEAAKRHLTRVWETATGRPCG